MNDPECPFSGVTLDKLPKGSACREYKDVPARSSYWRDDTDAVQRCADFSTDGDRDSPPDREGGGGGDGGPPDGGPPDDGDVFDRLKSGQAVSLSVVETDYVVESVSRERERLNIRGGDFFVADAHARLSPVSDRASKRVLYRNVTGDIGSWPATSGWDLKKNASDGPVSVEIVDEGETDDGSTWNGIDIPEEIGVWRLDSLESDRVSWRWERKKMDGGTVAVLISESEDAPGTYNVTVGNLDMLERERIDKRVTPTYAVDIATEFMRQESDGYDPAARDTEPDTGPEWERVSEDTYKLQGIDHPLFGGITPRVDIEETAVRTETRYRAEATIGPHETNLSMLEETEDEARAKAETWMDKYGAETFDFDVPDEVGDWKRTASNIKDRAEIVFEKAGTNESDRNVPTWINRTRLSIFYSDRKEKFRLQVSYLAAGDASSHKSPSEKPRETYDLTKFAWDEAVDYMREHPEQESEGVDAPRFTATFSNRTLKPVMEQLSRTANRGGYYANLHASSTGIRIQSLSPAKTRAGEAKIDDDGTMEQYTLKSPGKALIPIGNIADLVTDENMSETITLSLTSSREEGVGPYFRVKVGDTVVSPREVDNRLYVRDYDGDREFNIGPPDNESRAKFVARKLRRAVRAAKYNFADDDDAVLLGFGGGGDGFVLHHESDAGTLAHVEPEAEQLRGGNRVAGYYSFEHLDAVTPGSAIPRQASTTVQVHIAEEHPVIIRYEVNGVRMVVYLTPRIAGNKETGPMDKIDEVAPGEFEAIPTDESRKALLLRDRADELDQVFAAANQAVDDAVAVAEGENGLDGFNIRAVDAANVFLVDTDIGSRGLDHYGTTRNFEAGTKFGFTMRLWNDAHRLIDDESETEFLISDWKTVISTDAYTFRDVSIDPDNIRRRPDLPDAEYSVQTDVPGFKLTELVESGYDKDRNGSIALGVTDEGRVFGAYLHPEEFADEDFAMKLATDKVQPAAWSLYSIGKYQKKSPNRDYLKAISDAILDDSVQVDMNLSQNHPVEFEWFGTEGVTHTAILAPRVPAGKTDEEQEESAQKRTARVRAALDAAGIAGSVPRQTADLGVEMPKHLPDADDMELAEPLQSGEPVPDEVREKFNLGDGDAVLWTFPNSDGCRCGTQAQQLDQLAAVHGVQVIGITDDSPEDLRDMADALELEHVTLVSDESGDLSERLGVETDGTTPERRMLFVRDGRVTDVSGGVASQALEQAPEHPPEPETPDGTLTAFDGAVRLAEPNPDDPAALGDHFRHPSVGIVTGKRGSGKSAAAFELAERIAEHESIKKVTIATPEPVREAFPGDWLHVESLDEAPDRSIVVVDESYMKYNARTPLADDNQSLGPLVETSRHCMQSMLFVTQNSALLDKSAVGESDMLLMKRPGALHTRFERRQVRELSDEADRMFEELDAETPERFGYLYSNEYVGAVTNDMPDWYSDDISRSYAASCGVGTGSESLSSPCLPEPRN